MLAPRIYGIACTKAGLRSTNSNVLPMFDVDGRYVPRKRSKPSCREPSVKLFRKYRLKELFRSCNIPALVLFPVRVKSVLSAPVPEYDFETTSALSAQTFRKTSSNAVSSLVDSPRCSMARSVSCLVRIHRPNMLCTRFVRSKQSMQFVRTTSSTYQFVCIF